MINRKNLGCCQILVMALASYLCASACVAQQALPSNCGNLRPADGFGPFDSRPEGYIVENTYRSHAALLYIVESAHFTPEVETLIRGKSSALPGPDIHYTLSRFPNHHRALVAVENLSIRDKVDQPSGTKFTVECYFLRAVVWRPNDRIARMLFAQFLIHKSRFDEAAEQLVAAARLASDNPFTQYNVGLLYFEMKNYPMALEQAQKALALGLDRSELRDKLKGVNAWQDASPEPKAAAPEPASSAVKPTS